MEASASCGVVSSTTTVTKSVSSASVALVVVVGERLRGDYAECHVRSNVNGTTVASQPVCISG